LLVLWEGEDFDKELVVLDDRSTLKLNSSRQMSINMVPESIEPTSIKTGGKLGKSWRISGSDSA
jgi:hypothetical protein